MDHSNHPSVFLSVYLSILIVAAYSVAGYAQVAEEFGLPTDAPQDAIMAGSDEVKIVQDWSVAAFTGGSSDNSDKSFLAVTVPFSFRYGGIESAQLLKGWKQTEQTAKQADGVQRSIIWIDPVTNLAVTAVVTTFNRYPAVEWLLYFENQGQQDTPILEDVQALDVMLRTNDATQPAVLHRLTGDNCSDQTFLPYETPLEAGQEISMAPVGGRPSNTGAVPFFNFEYAGKGVITAVGWSGQWAATLQRAKEGPTRLRAGMELTHLVLHPGEKIRSPRILLMPWSGDRTTGHQRFRRLMMFHYAPKQDGRPLRLPTVAAQCFDRYIGHNQRPEFATEAAQLAAVKFTRELGGTAHWIDALWFKDGFPSGVGTWECKPEFSRGLKPISDACHEQGMKFVVWFEPERIGKGSRIAREFPELVFGGSNGGLFKLNDPEARRWLTELLSQRISEFGIDIYRNDFNMDPLDFWRGNDTPDRQGMTEIRYVEGHYAMWDELRARHPKLWIDNCASGGRRIDLETCMRAVSLSRSDTACWPDHEILNHVQTQGLSLYIPLSTTFTWTPVAYDVRSSSTAGTIGQFDCLDPQFPMDQGRAALAEAKANQPYWYGDYYPLSTPTLAADQWAAFQLHRADCGRGMVLAFRRQECPQPEYTVKLGGLDPASDYQVEFVDDAWQRTEKTIPGRELAEKLVIQLPKEKSSLLIRYRQLPAK